MKELNLNDLDQVSGGMETPDGYYYGTCDKCGKERLVTYVPRAGQTLCTACEKKYLDA